MVGVENADGSFERLTWTLTDAEEHEYAVTVGNADVKISVTFKGDATLDGNVNGVDLTIAKQAVLGTKTLSAFAALAADASENGRVDGPDLTLVKKAVLGTADLNW